MHFEVRRMIHDFVETRAQTSMRLAHTLELVTTVYLKSRTVDNTDQVLSAACVLATPEHPFENLHKFVLSKVSGARPVNYNVRLNNAFSAAQTISKVVHIKRKILSTLVRLLEPGRFFATRVVFVREIYYVLDMCQRLLDQIRE